MYLLYYNKSIWDIFNRARKSQPLIHKELYDLINTVNKLQIWIFRDKGSGEKVPGYYVHWAQGLFPAPLPQDSSLVDTVASLFWTLGVFLAKVLQDGRLVDLPLAIPFLKLLCQVNDARYELNIPFT